MLHIPYLIGVSGKAGSGKDLVGVIIQAIVHFKDLKSPHREVKIEALVTALFKFNETNFGSEVEIRKYATKLKKGLELDFPSEFSVDKWESGPREYREEIMPSLGMTRREALTSRGDALNSIKDGYFVKALFADPLPENCVITDVRFPDEVKAVLTRGGVVLRIERPGVPLGSHKSETALDDYPFKTVIVNDGSVKDLIYKILTYFKHTY